MASAGFKVEPEELDSHASASSFRREAVLDQLERVVQSAHFRNSKRYPALLSFIVQETLAGHTDSLKERTLGAEVFGRPVDYDTNADPVVRVTAGEVRKRIAQYYQAPGHEHELRFDLPLGSYVPHFLPPMTELAAVEAHPDHVPFEEDEAPSGSAAAHLETPSILSAEPAPPGILAVLPVSGAKNDRSRGVALAFLFAATAAVVAMTLIGIDVFRHPRRLAGVTFFWNPVLASKEPALIVLGMHSLDSNGRDISPASNASQPKDPQSMLSSMIRMDMVPVSDVVSYSRLTDLLARNEHPYRTQSAAETTFDQLRHSPVILLGGFDNVWTMRLTSNLRFRFVTVTDSIHEIEDIQNPGVVWTFDNNQSALSNSRDYALVGCFFDPQIEQYVLFAAGIGQSGTAAAAEFLTDDKYLLEWMARRGLQRHQNAEIVLSTEIIEGQHGPPQEVASYVW